MSLTPIEGLITKMTQNQTSESAEHRRIFIYIPLVCAATMLSRFALRMWQFVRGLLLKRTLEFHFVPHQSCLLFLLHCAM